MLKELPLVSSPLAEVAYLDNQLPKDRHRPIQLRESDLRTLNETLVNIISITELVRKLGADGAGAPMPSSERECVTRTGTAPKKSYASFKRLPLAGSTVVQRITQTVHPELFGRELRDELAAGESALAKSVQRLRQRSRQDKAGSKPKRLVMPYVHDKLTLAAKTLKFAPRWESNRIAGRMSDFADAWFALTTDPLVRGAIVGYQLPFRSRPQLKEQGQPRGTTPKAVADSLEQLQMKGAISKAKKGTPVWISTMFGIPKKDGSCRPIVNLKPLNSFLKIPHFKVKGLHLVPVVVLQGDYCTKVGMTDSYFGVNIAEELRPYLVFFWDNEVFWCTCLPFGLATAPYVYTKIMRVVAEHFRSLGTRVIFYLDDWAFFAKTPELLRKQLRYALEVFAKLALHVNMEKSVIGPTQELEFLGLILDTRLRTLSIPESKINKSKEDAESLLRPAAITARELSQFLGRVN
ncbi:hypothetical protein Aduo_018665 [Ancylostoma duodenale]